MAMIVISDLEEIGELNAEKMREVAGGFIFLAGVTIAAKIATAERGPKDIDSNEKLQNFELQELLSN